MAASPFPRPTVCPVFTVFMQVMGAEGDPAARDPVVRLVRGLMREEKEARPSETAARRALLRVLAEDGRVAVVRTRPTVQGTKKTGPTS